MEQVQEKEISLESVFKAAKAFKNEIPELRDHTVRIKFIEGHYRVMFEKVNDRGNNVGFAMLIPVCIK